MSTKEIEITNRLWNWPDFAGMVASVGCAIHCALMPFVIGYLPTLGLHWLATEEFHIWMALICFLLALFAFYPGLKRHGKWLPILTGMVGLSLLMGSAFAGTDSCCPTPEVESLSKTVISEKQCTAEACHACPSTVLGSQGASQIISEPKLAKQATSFQFLLPWITPLGGLILVSAHLMNHSCSCKCCQVGKKK